MKYKVIIAGSRGVTEEREIKIALVRARLSPRNVAEVVSGTARGVDQLGERVARQFNIPVKRFPADGNQYGKRAGFLRNAEMAEYADILVAVWDGKSKGTAHMMGLMAKAGKPVYVYTPERYLP